MLKFQRKKMCVFATWLEFPSFAQAEKYSFQHQSTGTEALKTF